MIAKDLIKRIRAEKGSVFVEIANFNDTHWVKVVKSDLIEMVSREFNFDDETGYELNSFGLFSKELSV
jgi:hypothetical protein